MLLNVKRNVYYIHIFGAYCSNCIYNYFNQYIKFRNL